MSEVPNPKDLSKIIDLCRKKGVESIEFNGIKIVLRSEAPASSYKRKKSNTPEITETQYSDEDILMWSASGIPSEALNG